MRDQLVAAMDERDQILTAMDVEAAKRFIVKHGGSLPKRSLDWLKVLHIARFEWQGAPKELVTESRIYLARNGAQSMVMLPSGSPYLRAAQDLLFPRNPTEAYVRWAVGAMSTPTEAVRGRDEETEERA